MSCAQAPYSCAGSGRWCWAVLQQLEWDSDTVHACWIYQVERKHSDTCAWALALMRLLMCWGWLRRVVAGSMRAGGRGKCTSAVRSADRVWTCARMSVVKSLIASSDLKLCEELHLPCILQLQWPITVASTPFDNGEGAKSRRQVKPPHRASYWMAKTKASSRAQAHGSEQRGTPSGAQVNAHATSFRHLTPELLRRIAACLPTNDVAALFKFANKSTAAALTDFTAVAMGETAAWMLCPKDGIVPAAHSGLAAAGSPLHP